jgi:DinB family protein
MIDSMSSRHFACVFTVAASLLAAPVGAQQSATSSAAKPLRIQTVLADDVATMADKFAGLARAMAGKYDWRPGQGVRSVAEVFNLIVDENRMLAGLLSGTQGGRGAGARGGKPAPIADPAEMQEALRSTYATLRQAVAGLSDSDLNATVRMFGQDTTKQSAVLMLLFDQHEHLGQSIAYARTNNVVPPWSK